MKRVPLVGVVVALPYGFFLPTAFSQPMSATDLGPAPLLSQPFGLPDEFVTGRLSAIACSSTDPEKYFVGGPGSGVWRRDPPPAQGSDYVWTPLTDHLPAMAVGALAIDPNDEDIIYAGTGDAEFAHHSPYGLGLYKSTDGGNTWQHLAESTFGGRCFSRIIIDPTVSGGVSPTLYASIVRAGGFPEASAAKVHPGRWGPVGVFRSGDGGINWTHFTNGLPNDLSVTGLAMHPSDPSVLYAAVGHIFGDERNGIYKSDDGGLSWTKKTSGFPVGEDIGRITLAVAPTAVGVVYALVATPTTDGTDSNDYGGFQSTDGGESWQSYGGIGRPGKGDYVSAIIGDLADSSIVYYGGGGTARRQLTPTTAQFIDAPHGDYHVFAWDAAGRLLTGNDGGLHRSEGGTYPGEPGSWTSLNEGLSILQCYAGLSVHPTNPDVMLVGNQDNGTVRRDGPLTADWEKVLPSDGGMTYFAPAGDPQVAYASANGVGSIYKSTNAGVNWTDIGDMITSPPRQRVAFQTAFQLDPSDANRLIACTQEIWETTNQGGTWTKPGSGDLTSGDPWAIRAVAIAPSNSDVIYVATNEFDAQGEPNARVRASSDGGQTFNIELTGHPGWRRITREIFIDPYNPQVVYVARARFDDPIGQILRKTPPAGNWPSIAGNTFPRIPVNTIVGHYGGNGVVLYAGTDSGLYWSVNQGSTWYHYTGMLNAIIVDIVVDDPRDRLIIGTQGRGVWSVDVDSPWAFGSPDFNRDGVVDALDPVAFQEGLLKGDPYAIDLDLSTGPKSGDLLDLVAFTGAWTAAAKK